MSQHRILLLGSQSLLAEGIEDILKRQGDIEVFGPYAMTADAVSHAKGFGPDLVVIADESSADAALVALILRIYPEIPVVNVDLEESRVHIYKSEQVAATAASFVATIRDLLTRASNGELALRDLGAPEQQRDTLTLLKAVGATKNGTGKRPD